MNSASASTFFSTPVSFSFSCCSPLMLRLYPSNSVSMLSSCSCCFRSASSVACRASSRRAMPMRELFHCCASCFFSKLMASISCSASFSVSCAARVSRCWATSCASYSWCCWCRRLSCSCRLSMRKSCSFFSFSMFVTDSSATYVARRVTAISFFICSLYASICFRVPFSLSSSTWNFSTLRRSCCVVSFFSSVMARSCSRSWSACSRIRRMTL
mmetsp:Transcript_17470/g.38044  ORF Transcript_17470/g.38044 Transcript_17470/m.38044 type:complete len:214 (-) Transcript_17470:507-1148(-)